MSISGRRFAVVGAGSGIGAALAAVLEERGAVVARIDVAGAPIMADVRSAGSVAAALDAAVAGLGGLDGVVNCAGIMRAQRAPVEAVTAEDWAEVLAVNLTGSFHVAQAAAARLGDGGVIVLVGSRAGVTGPSGSVPYGASKGGVHGLGMTLAEALAPRGIRVHTVLPGDVDTPLMERSLDEALGHGADPEAVARRRESLTTPRAVAEGIAWLLDPRAASVVGPVTTV